MIAFFSAGEGQPQRPSSIARSDALGSPNGSYSEASKCASISGNNRHQFMLNVRVFHVQKFSATCISLVCARADHPGEGWAILMKCASTTNVQLYTAEYTTRWQTKEYREWIERVVLLWWTVAICSTLHFIFCFESPFPVAGGAGCVVVYKRTLPPPLTNQPKATIRTEPKKASRAVALAPTFYISPLFCLPPPGLFGFVQQSWDDPQATCQIYVHGI